MNDNLNNIDRQPAVAGKFYPAKPEELEKQLNDLFAAAVPKQCHQVRAIICPHAGYVFSGKVAASAFNQIDGEANYKRVFIIASSHHVSFKGGSIFCEGDFDMPYGKEIVDTSFGKMLVERFPDIFTSDPAPHKYEHSVEVQLPFLHHALKTNYCIVPIVLGTSDPSICERIASVLKPWLTSDNLFIISTDFSHYPQYSDAQKVDEITKDAILSNSPKVLLSTLAENAKKQIPNLATSLCGWTSVLTLLYMTAYDDLLEYQAIKYSNSGDSEDYGDTAQVVGYWGITLSERQTVKEDFELIETDKKTLLNIARKTLEDNFREGKTENIEEKDYSATLKTRCGAFVSLHEKGALRGCIGRLIGNLPLYKMVQEMALSAATNDYRFKPVEVQELPNINIEISVLSPLKKIDDIAEIELGKHGIYIEKGQRSGVFLPQVATETGWDKEAFLGHCSRDKAGLDWDGWKTAKIYIFTATVFNE